MFLPNSLMFPMTFQSCSSSMFSWMKSIIHFRKSSLSRSSVMSWSTAFDSMSSSFSSTLRLAVRSSSLARLRSTL